MQHIAQKITSTKELIRRLNEESKLSLGFFELLPNTITVIAGRSGSGKSLLLDLIRTNILEDENVSMLSLELEMIAEYQIMRSLASLTGKDINDIMAGDYSEEALEELSSKDLYFVESLSSVRDYHDIIFSFASKAEKPRIVVTLDHALLVNFSSSEKQALDALMWATIRLKKDIQALGKEVYFIILSQFNRDIESDARIANPYMHIPIRSDIHGSSAIFAAADYVFAIHNPSSIGGMGPLYTHKGYPVKEDGKAVIWIHGLKNRFGKLNHYMFLEEFSKGKLILKTILEDEHFKYV